jgi:hypothetical protein
MALIYTDPPRPRVGRARWRDQAVALAPAALTLVLATVVYLVGWRGVDQAAQAYRVIQFREHGLMLWDSGWYGGNFPLGYSVLFPPVAALLGIPVTAVVSAAIATWAFDRVVTAYFGSRPLGTWYFAVSTLLPVAIGQLPFLAGEAAGLAALVALHKGRKPLAVGLGILSALFSPLAAAFLAMACLAWAAHSSRRRGWLVATAAVSLGVILTTGALFPGDGPFPFPWSSLVVTELLCLTALTPLVQTTPAVRIGALFYAVASLFSFLVPNPLGGNAPRLAASIGVPLLACFCSARGEVLTRLTPSGLVRRLAGGRGVELTQRWRIAAVIVVVPFAVWQWAPSQKIVSTSSAPETQKSFYQPLIDELAVVAPDPVRVEIPPTLEHWEAAFVAPHVSLARGWERQLDIADNPIFYNPGALTAASYQKWLDQDGITYVALPAVPLDYAAVAEGKLLQSGQVKTLVPVWHTADWQLWRVAGSPGLTSGPARLTSLAPDHVNLDVSQPGMITIRVRYTTYWHVGSGAGCVGPASDGWTYVDAYAAGPVSLAAAVLHSGPSSTCPAPFTASGGSERDG